jgi:hypothetical protein
VRFDWQRSWRLESTVTRRSYAEEELGLVAKLPNPANPERWVVLLAGIHTAGTLAAILAVADHARELLGGYRGGAFHAVVRGLDRDGDGRADEVAVVESSS